MRKKAFTLLEVIVVVAIFFTILAVVLQLYFRLTGSRTLIQARQTLVQEMYYAMNNIQVLLADFSIDYEEYFNRSMIGCDIPQRYDASVGFDGHCSLFTSYGNYNSIPSTNAPEHILYACSSQDDQTAPEYVLQDPAVLNGQGCFPATSSALQPPYYQSFGQYARHFTDVGTNTDSKTSIIGDIDDEDIGVGPQSFSGSQVPELYLLSHDGLSRLYIRRALVDSGDRNQDGIISGANEIRYTLQILRLTAVDAGQTHDFNLSSSGVMDGQVDTRVCDSSKGFICIGDSPGDAYANFHMPADSNDGWVNILSDDITITDRHVMLTPDRDPLLARNNVSAQISPTIQLSISAALYGKNRQSKVDLNDITIQLQTSYTIKQNYVQP